MTDTLPDGMVELLAAHLAVQRWYGGAATPSPEQIHVERARQLWAAPDGERRLWQAIVDVDGHLYQLLLGERPAGEPADFLHGREQAVVGSLGASYFYDATLDGELARVLLEVASGGEQTAHLARPVTAEQSNTSIVYDDRLILKVFRRLHEGRNPDVEVTSALAAAGFDHVAAPLVTWSEDGIDLAFGQQFLAGGAEGWALAITSLRDLYSCESEHPGQAGGDFAAEAGRLGRMTAMMHLALAGGFGLAPREASADAWFRLVESLPVRLAAAGEEARKGLAQTAAPLVERLRAVEDPGPFFRVHGDYHLGQVMRTDSGWYVLDFEGEPAKGLVERSGPESPLKDVTSMLRSFHYAARYALRERSAAEQQSLEPLARAWESHNRQAFLEGYRQPAGIDALLPGAEAAPAVLSGYELDKALYELDYELSHRPEWVSIPLDALDRLTGGEEQGG